MDETWQMISTFKTDGDKESFEHCKLILGPKMAYFCTPVSDTSASFFGAKMGHFWPQNESGVFETVFIFFCPKS